jgi:hypothetical protein
VLCYAGDGLAEVNPGRIKNRECVLQRYEFLGPRIKFLSAPISP